VDEDFWVMVGRMDGIRLPGMASQPCPSTPDRRSVATL
jgi:hypothetical protein